jgi:Ran GTPase-activating protein (RanGAP) involved in mRNA processing and transport
LANRPAQPGEPERTHDVILNDIKEFLQGKVDIRLELTEISEIGLRLPILSLITEIPIRSLDLQHPRNIAFSSRRQNFATTVENIIKNHDDLKFLHLNFRGIWLDNDSCNRLVLALKDLKAEAKLDFSESDISIRRVIDLFGSGLRIRDIGLSSLSGEESLTNADINALAQILRTDIYLERLDLSLNNIGDEVAIAWADVIRSNSVLQDLDLSGNAITNAGAHTVGSALAQNQTIRRVDLRGGYDDISEQMKALLRNDPRIVLN